MFIILATVMLIFVFRSWRRYHTTGYNLGCDWNYSWVL